MSQLRATKIDSNDPNTYLTCMVSHTTFGITKGYLLTNIMDQSVYEPDFDPLGEPGECSE